MDMQSIMAMMGRQQGMQQPPGAYGAPQYAPNAQVGLGTGGASRDVQPGIMEMIQAMMMKKKAEQMGGMPQMEAMAPAAPQVDTHRLQQQATEKAMMEYINNSMRESMARSAEQDAAGGLQPGPRPGGQNPLSAGPQGLGAMGDMRMHRAMQQAGAL